MCNKFHFGWLDPDVNSVILKPGGKTSWAGKLVPFDRYDVVPGSNAKSRSNSNIFAVRYNLGGDPMQPLYVAYRSSHGQRGASVEYCDGIALPGSNSGWKNTHYGIDANGDTKEMDDSYVAVGTTLVVAPPFLAREAAGGSMLSTVPFLVVRVTDASPDFPSACSNPALLKGCPSNLDISISVEVSLLDVVNTPMPVPILQTYTIPASTEPVPAHATDLQVVRFLQPDALRTTVSFRVCPADASTTASAYLYEDYPWSPLKYGSPLGYGAVNRFKGNFADCCSSTMSIQGVQVIVIRNGHVGKEGVSYPLDLAEVEVYERGSDVNLIQDSWVSECYHLVQGQEDATDLNKARIKKFDGDETTHEASAKPHTGAYFKCVLDRPRKVGTVRIVRYEDKTEEVQVELYAVARAAAPGYAGLVKSELLVSASANGVSEMTLSKKEATESRDVKCVVEKDISKQPWIQFDVALWGAYVMIEPGTIFVPGPMAARECVKDQNVFLYAKAQSCVRCPKRVLASDDGNYDQCPTKPRSIDVVQFRVGKETVFGESTVSEKTGLSEFQDTKQRSRKLRRRSVASDDWRLADGSTSVGSLNAAKVVEPRGLDILRAVRITQLSGKRFLHLCEIRLLDMNDEPLPLTCTSTPAEGKRYTGDLKTEVDVALFDGKAATCAVAGVKGKAASMQCVLDSKKAQVSALQIVPDKKSAGTVRIELFKYRRQMERSRPIYESSGIKLGSKTVTLELANLAKVDLDKKTAAAETDALELGATGDVVGPAGTLQYRYHESEYEFSFDDRVIEDETLGGVVGAVCGLGALVGLAAAVQFVRRRRRLSRSEVSGRA